MAFDKFPQITACEILSTGTCPLNCKYCYIPKVDAMKDIHEEIKKDLESGEFITRLQGLYGDNMEYLGFWGTEPLLTLGIIARKMDDMFTAFPKLSFISFSTAMLYEPLIIYDFVQSIKDRDVKLSVQISLDGPAFITDVNRIEGAAEKIPRVFMELVKLLNTIKDMKCKVDFKWKATLDPSNIALFNSDPSLIKDYYDFFLNCEDDFTRTNTNKNVKFNYGSYTPTLMVPGKYTNKEGKDLAIFVKNIHATGNETTYTHRLRRLFEYGDELYKRRMFSCSGGDANFGVGKDIHICHRTFYLNNDDYINAIMDKESTIGDIDNWDVTLFKRKSIENVRKNFIIDIDDDDDINRFLYVLRGYHDYSKLQMNSAEACIIELAYSGQINKIYLKNKKLRKLFALFVHQGFSCPMENVLNTGSIHTQVLSIMRMLGNGAFMEIVRKVKEDYEQLPRTK